MTEGTSEYRPPSLYAISASEFTNIHPDQVAPYKPGDPVTRENFMRFYIDSFAKSQGRASVQTAYFAWYQQNRRFDYRQTLQNFYDAGAGDILSSAEQHMWFKYFQPIKAHAPEGGMEMSPENSLYVLRVNVLAKLGNLEAESESFLPPERLKDMPFSTFMHYANEYIKNSKQTGVHWT